MTLPSSDDLSWCRVGSRKDRIFTISSENTALSLGGDLPVVGTPVLIWWAEIVASDLIRSLSCDRCGSAGTRVNIVHRGSAKVGDTVKVSVSILTTIFRMSRFAIEVVHEQSGAPILEGEHDRVIIEAPIRPVRADVLES